MLRFLTAGESHGPGLTVVIDGLPAGEPVEDLIKPLERALGEHHEFHFRGHQFEVPAADTPFSLYNSGMESQLNENYYEAIELYKKALELNPNYKDPLFGLAESYFYLQEFDQALEYINRALELDHNDTGKKIFKARILVGLGDFREAGDIFNTVLEEQPNNMEANFGLSELKIANGKLKEAAIAFEETLNFSPNNRRALLSLVLIYDELGETELAGEYLRKALYYHSGNSQVRYVAGIHYYGSNQFRNSEEQLKTALALSESFSDAAVLLSRIYIQNGQYSEAKDLLDDIISKVKNDPILYYFRGLCSFSSGDYLNAMNDMTKVITLRPDVEIPRLIIEEILLSSSSLLEAYGSRYSDIRIQSGDEQLKSYNKRLAEEEYRRALLLEPDSIDARYTMGKLYKHEKLYGKYAEIMRILNELDPDSVLFQDEFEITESIIEDSVANNWDLSQFSVSRDSVSLSLYYYSKPASLVYQASEPYIASITASVFEGKDWIRIRKPVQISSYADAFKLARNDDSDFFVIFSFQETDRSFYLKSEIFKTSNGVKVDQTDIQRTGNNRVFSSVVNTVDAIAAKMPLIGSIVKISGSKCVINIGKCDNLGTGDQIPVIMKDKIYFKADSTDIAFPDEAVIGKITVTQTDDLVSEALIESAGIFNLINTGDQLPFAYRNTETYEQKPFYTVNSVLMELFRLH